MAGQKNLVIVESPSKAKTIEKYLGSEYLVKASMGHLRDLPENRLGVDIDNDFKPEYIPMESKQAVISELRKAAKNADSIYLATDPDREGEAISWHLKELLDIPDEKTQRITFNEITKRVVLDSIKSPRKIDSDLVDAQQARRVLDRIVGYQLSPLLWKKIRPSGIGKHLSAGRVQSVATRLVIDRENEIRAFRSEEYWTLAVILQRSGKPGKITALFYGDPKKKTLSDEEAVKSVVGSIQGKTFTVSAVKRTEKRRQPAPPFITSTLQQEASRKLNMAPYYTMSIAQQLYEGVDVKGEGTIGLITYMRTDSLRVSEEALSAAGGVIRSRYGDAYYTGARRYKTKGAAQDAHEAIRPSDVSLTPDTVKGDLSRDQYRLYKLIWERFLASQMANAVYDAVTADITCGNYVFRAADQKVKFAGFTAIYEESTDDETQKQQSSMPDVNEGESLTLADTDSQQHFTQPPARYTEASLIRALEENGVGRPSTYASIISTIERRGYVERVEKHLVPTAVGETVNDFLSQHFLNIIDVEFTANMEEKLDTVETGKVQWKQILRDFYKDFGKELKDGESAEQMRVPEETTEEVCEVCGRNLVVKIGPFGKFLGCPGYPECKFTKPFAERMPGRCPKCGGGLLRYRGKSKTTNKNYTLYYCENRKTCDFSTFDIPTEDNCSTCGETMFKLSGKGRRKPFCINPTCKDFLPEDKRGYDNKSDAKKSPAKKKTNG
ncbi:MAG: type I DNA topoisomerase [Oscillospiraceae bacterium]|nr:type I DNA topoisomerase [Oscillospiraceae bacterium]